MTPLQRVKAALQTILQDIEALEGQEQPASQPTIAPDVPPNPSPTPIAPTTITPPTSPFNAKVQNWAKAVRQEEGWCAPGKTLNGVVYPNGTPSYQHNSPGNLKKGEFTEGFNYTSVDADGFLIFGTAIEGFDALCQFLTNSATGKYAPIYEPSMSLLAYCETYGNPPDDGYANGIANALGVSVETPISELI